MTRRFESKKAVREQVPLLIGLYGVSGSGKTFSALRLARGIQRVAPGSIFVIDTEAKRALHYSEDFEFEHLEFTAPFSPMDYLAAIEHCVSKGAGTIIIDSASHEHEGPGGVLEMHDKYLDEKAGNNYKQRDKLTFSAWIKPKQERTRLINTMLQFKCNFILCFRAKEKIRIVRGEDPVQLGFMPIGAEELVYEMTASALLPPGSGGVPQWNPAEAGSKMMVKLPKQFREVLTDGKPLSEAHGEALARWAAGGSPVQAKEPSKAFTELLASIAGADFVEDLELVAGRIKGASLNALETAELRKAYKQRKTEIASTGREPGDDAEEMGSES